LLGANIFVTIARRESETSRNKVAQPSPSAATAATGYSVTSATRSGTPEVYSVASLPESAVTRRSRSRRGEGRFRT